MKDEKVIRELYNLRLREFKLCNQQDLFGDVTPRLLSDLRWVLEIGEFAPESSSMNLKPANEKCEETVNLRREI